jgi:hypothetical protein
MLTRFAMATDRVESFFIWLQLVGKQQSRLFGLALALVGFTIVGSPAKAGEPCSMATMKGDYLYAQDGVIPGKSVDKNQFFAQAGREHFDGNGAMSGIYSGNFNGTIIRGSYSGTYTMKADCSGTVRFTDNTKQVYNYDIFATQGGSEFVFVQTDSNSITSAYQRRRAAP